VVLGILILLLFIFLFKLNTISRAVILIFGVINMNVLFVFRIGAYRIFKYYRSKGFNLKYVLIIADKTCENYINMLINNKEWGYRIKGIITDSKYIEKKYKDNIPILPPSTSIKDYLTNDIIDEVIYSKNKIDQNWIESLIYECETIGVVFKMQSQLLNMSRAKANIDYAENIPFLTFVNTPSNQLALSFKWAISFISSFLILSIWFPVMILISIAIKLDSRGPVIFKQMRVGLRGRTFYMYKFRTMVQNAEKLRNQLEHKNEVDGPVFKIKDDPRITRIGRILRKTGLDELPQFINILKGDMSLVGPRPPIPEEVKKYKSWQLRRLSMKPGLTCIWQIMPNRNQISFEDWMKLDLQYIDNWSIKQDIILFFKTIRTVLSASGE
jgi:exopolysaccharide biosynthesis polyprenyl glycosylphosphotransferase